jgi:cytidine deaminase
VTVRPDDVDEHAWNELTRLANDACRAAYVPYSGFPVGAAARVDDGRRVSGCNVENAGYGVTLCAECGLVSDLVRTGGGRLLAFVCVGADGGQLSPCGRCRQLLHEHAAPGMLLAIGGGRHTIEEVLPFAFGRDDLDRAERAGTTATAAAPPTTTAPTGAEGERP